MDTTEKIKICKIVAQAILSDGQVTDSEHAFIKDLMDKYEIDEAQRKEILARNLEDDPTEMVAGIDAFESKNQLMVELVMAVAADNELSPSEQGLLNTVARAIGVPENEMDMLVKNALM